MKQGLPIHKINSSFNDLITGKEKGLNYFYNLYFDLLFYRTLRATTDDCASQSIVQEAFFRLWLFREQITLEKEIPEFLKSQIRSAINAYYSKTQNRFQRSLLRLDSIENYQEFMFGYELEEEPDDDIFNEEQEIIKKERQEILKNLLPNLNSNQQLFIKLCLKYSFNYERIAYYLGGISDYEVSLQVEKTIDKLRQICNSTDKLKLSSSPVKIILQGEFDNEQSEIFHMRYELQFSFEQISNKLNLSEKEVKTLFIQAHAKLKHQKKIA